jgi:hypothetical protein
MILISDRPLPPIPDRLLSEHVLADALTRGERPALIDALTGETSAHAWPDLGLDHVIYPRLRPDRCTSGVRTSPSRTDPCVGS